MEQEGANNVDGNPAPAQRARVILEPLDDILASHSFFVRPSITEIQLQTLESKDAFQARLNTKYLDVQIVRIITPVPQSHANTYSHKKNGNQNNAVTFSHMILCKVHSAKYPEQSNKLVYLMEARNLNQNLWNRNVNHRDNGAVSIGSLIRIPCPMPVDTWMRGGIPLLVTHFPVFVLKYPATIPSIRMHNEIGGETLLAFVANNADLQIYFTSVIKTSCTGSLCDKQRVTDWLGSRGCGCYGMASNSTSLCIQHSIAVTTFHGDLSMKEFSSTKFSKLYMDGDIPGSCRLYHLQLTDAYNKLLECIDTCINFINDHDGFTIVGWYKRGIINDKSLMAQDKNTSGYVAPVEPEVQCDS